MLAAAFCRETVVRLGKTEGALVRSLERDSLLLEREERLMSIRAVGPITALELGRCAALLVDQESHQLMRVVWCGKSSGNTMQGTPLSKQRNKHLQTT